MSAIYCVIRCILYPGTSICIASGTKGQAINVLNKIIQELEPLSDELRAEIDDKKSHVNNTDAIIMFHNTSRIQVVTASDSARGNRANVVLVDEYRLVPEAIINDVLKKFLTYRRMPVYAELTEEERQIEYDKEKHMVMYLSSAWFKDHWSYTKCLDTWDAMVDGRRQFVCGFPYQLSLAEGLLDREFVEDEMAETSFNEIHFMMEMQAEFYGSAEGAFFDFESISKNRKIDYPMLPEKLSSKLNSSNLRITPKRNGEIRILSADIALMSSRKHDNDATAIFINQMMPTKAGRYMSNIIYPENCEGLRTEEQALVIRRLFDEYSCDYLVIDSNGIGLGVSDALMRDITDPETGEIYPAISCCNNPDMAARCTVQNAKKVMWCIKASAQFNSDAAVLLREGFKSGRIRLLINEFDAETMLKDIKGYTSLNPPERMKILMPYINTTLLIDELVNLQHYEQGGKVKIYEKAHARKDRYSSLSYNYYVALQIEQRMGKRTSSSGESRPFIVRPPNSNTNRKAVRNNDTSIGWY